MIAIVELNPRAFRDQNINQLLRGAELRLPDVDKAGAIDEAAAAAEVAAQNRAFRQRTSADTPVVSASGRAEAEGTEEPAAADAQGRESGQAGVRGDAADDPRLNRVCRWCRRAKRNRAAGCPTRTRPRWPTFVSASRGPRRSCFQRVRKPRNFSRGSRNSRRSCGTIPAV